MTIGELARTTGCGVETIRYYEREGLLPRTARTNGNFRRYGEEHARQLSFIRHCRSLDMSLNEIGMLLKFRSGSQENCGEVNILLDTHLRHVEGRIAELQSLERELQALREKCNGGRPAADCGILRGLGGAPNDRDASADNHVPRTHSTRTRT